MTVTAVIEGTGFAVPQKCITNEQVIHRLQKNIKDKEVSNKLTPAWILNNVGVRFRYSAGSRETNAYLGSLAALRALDDASMSLKNIDYIIGVTSTPDEFTPSFASATHEILALVMDCSVSIPASDKNAACSGVIYALAEAYAYIKSGLYNNILIVGCDRIYSKHINWKDPVMGPSTAQIFGDGAFALVVRGYHENKFSFGIKDFILSGKGNTKDLVGKKGRVHMNGGKVFKFAVTEGHRLLREMLRRQGLSTESINWFLLHQANKRINDAILGKQEFNIPEQKCPSTIELFGNTAGASLGMLMAYASGSFKVGDKLLLFAAGAGFTSAVMYLVWGKGAGSY